MPSPSKPRLAGEASQSASRQSREVYVEAGEQTQKSVPRPAGMAAAALVRLLQKAARQPQFVSAISSLRVTILIRSDVSVALPAAVGIEIW